MSNTDNKDVLIAGTTIGALNIKSASINAIKEGKSGSWITNNYKGTRVLSSYSPIDMYGYKWGIIVEKEESEALEDINKQLFKLMRL